jgi:VWFA-related protein
VSEVKSFSRFVHQRLLVGVVVDMSESIRPDQQLDMLNILDALAARLDNSQDRAFLVGFSNRVKVLQPPTSDLALVRKSLLEHAPQSGLTSLFDAVVATCRDPFESSETEQQRIMVLFSDGLDTLSIHGLEDAIDAALRARVSVYTVATQGTSQRGSRILETLANKTGGKAYIVGKKHDVATAIAGVTEPALDEYAVTFRPVSNHTGYHRIELQLRSGRAVLLRAGYVLEPN